MSARRAAILPGTLLVIMGVCAGAGCSTAVSSVYASGLPDRVPVRMSVPVQRSVSGTSAPPGAPGSHGASEQLHRIPLEEYVAGVVAAELPLWSAPRAQLEAQAIAARSYALRALERRGQGGFLWSDTRDQVYRGPFESDGSPGLERVARKLEDAVASTRGIVLWRDGQVLDARFHAACGGRTCDLRDIFGDESDARIPSAPCPACGAQLRDERAGIVRENVQELGWEHTASAEELDALVRQRGLGERFVALQPGRRDAGGRWLSVELRGDRGSAVIPFAELRSGLGAGELKSGRIVSLQPTDGRPRRGTADGPGTLTFRGLGFGHGVGLCQRGSRRLATAGWTTERILKHYYPGATLRRSAP